MMQQRPIRVGLMGQRDKTNKTGSFPVLGAFIRLGQLGQVSRLSRVKPDYGTPGMALDSRLSRCPGCPRLNSCLMG